MVSSFSRVDANYKQQRIFKFFAEFVLKLILHVFSLFSGTPWLATHRLKGQREKSVSTKRFSVFIRTRTPVQNEKTTLERFRSRD